MSTLSSIDLHQYVLHPTHNNGHTIDLVIKRNSECDLINSCHARRILNSDHFVVNIELNQSKPTKQKVTSSFRNFKELDVKSFKTDLDKELNSMSNSSDPNTAMTQLNNALVEIIDKHAPLETKSRNLRLRHKWYNDEIHDARRKRRKLERALRKNVNELNRQL